MANTTVSPSSARRNSSSHSQQRTQQVPQHVTALLSHLTSRPGVQSTLILSRKDGSIIQSTGQLAAPTSLENSSSRPPISSPSEPNPLSAQSTDSSPASPALACFGTGVSLARPAFGESPATGEATQEYGVGKGPREEDRDGDAGREEDDEVKLLRMRTRKHEIVVVPDRKYLLCVVHDAAPGPATSTRSR
ncbi:uncharacterized protein N7511_011199 [Penicillium nucicola]|uniref:uncharacterized protein n=1 Tax=Penicillium nucicola TaxID=1850975 RepID=UPI00254585D5|nr:uncharacterized protein N7511_011199 [Penicillium nucicola]KAJ5742798.1 hypothetical protein N7511_011199 [Penicillium nucicola]